LPAPSAYSSTANSHPFHILLLNEHHSTLVLSHPSIITIMAMA